MSGFLRDVRFALRILARAPALSLIAVLTLGVAIGANTTVFSVVNAVILQPLPFRDPDRLVLLHTRSIGAAWQYERGPMSGPEYIDLVEHTHSYEAIGASLSRGVPVTAGSGPERVSAALVAGPWFRAVGTTPLLGRAFSREEDRPAHASVAILGYGLWQRAFGGDPQVLGKRISVDGNMLTVVGVMPPGFSYPEPRTELWAPLEREWLGMDRDGHFLDVVARLAPGVDLAHARAELDGFMAWQRERYAGNHPLGGALVGETGSHSVVVNSLYAETVSTVKWSLLLLQGAVAFLLLIAAANIASLLLARTEARSREIAIRAAVGAGRTRLVRQLLTESLVLGVFGAGLGLGLAFWGVDLAVGLLPENAPRRGEIGIDRWVLLVAIGSSVATSFVFGLAPAVHTRIERLHAALKEGARATAGKGRLRLRRVLVVVEVALAVLLVVGCGLILRSFAAIQRVGLGFDPQGLVTMRIELPATTYPELGDIIGVWNRVETEVRRLPGVESATLASHLPPVREAQLFAFARPGRPARGQVPTHSADYNTWVGDDYAATMGIRVVRGRDLGPRDRDGAPPVLLINEAMARKFWPGGDPIGSQIAVGGPYATIVGVTADVKQGGADQPPGAAVIIPTRQVRHAGQRSMALVVRGSDPRDLVRGVREVLAHIDPNLPVAEVHTMDEILWEAVARPRFFAVLLGGFAAVALLLAAIGIFGVMSYSISQRTRDFGIRMALGALPIQVRRMVLFEGLQLVLLGIGLGLAGAAALNTALSRVLAGMLYGVEALDPVTFALVPVVIAAIGALASWIPASRATRADPMLALRHD